MLYLQIDFGQVTNIFPQPNLTFFFNIMQTYQNAYTKLAKYQLKNLARQFAYRSSPHSVFQLPWLPSFFISLKIFVDNPFSIQNVMIFPLSRSWIYNRYVREKFEKSSSFSTSAAIFTSWIFTNACSYRTKRNSSCSSFNEVRIINSLTIYFYLKRIYFTLYQFFLYSVD